jgi:hypothetical protein
VVAGGADSSELPGENVHKTEARQGKKAIAKTNWPLGTSMTKRNKAVELFYVLDSTGRGGRARIYSQIAVGGMEVAVEAPAIDMSMEASPHTRGPQPQPPRSLRLARCAGAPASA